MMQANNIVKIFGRQTILKGVVLLPDGCDKNDVRPAEITEGFLLKNGWKTTSNGWIIGKNEFSYATLTPVADKWSIQVENGTESYRGWISSIHELQNIMEICRMKSNWKL